MPVEAITRATAFIEANLTEDITVADMAAAAGYSLYHFCRTFSSITLHTPYDYLVRRRLSQAACHLVAGSAKIITIAMDYQFKNQETFSRAFKRVFGLQPNQARLPGRIDPRLLLPYLSEAHLRFFRAHSGLHPERVTQEPLALMGLMTALGPGVEAKQALWSMLKNLLPAGDGRVYTGITFYPPGWEAQGRLYFAGTAEVPAFLKNSILVRKTIPALDYLCFPVAIGWQDSPYIHDYCYAGRLLTMGVRPLPDYEIEVYSGALPFQSGEWPGSQIWLPIR